MSKYIKVEDLQAFCDNQKDHCITPNDFQRFNHIEIKEPHGDWHTGTPTEEGDYLVEYHWGLDNKIMHDMASRILYGATTFKNGSWKIDYPYVVIAWQKIEPYEASN